MAADIGPELYDQILRKFNEKYEKAQLFGEPVADVLARIKSGDATFRDADLYAVEVGSMISDSMKEVMKLDALPDKTLYYNIAKKTIEPALREEHRLVSDVARAVQDIYYDDLGIGLKAAAPEFNQKRSDTVVDNACQASTQEKLDASIDQPVKTFAQAINDDAKKKNAGIQSKAGLQVTVTRIYDKVGLRRGTKHSERCSWCLERCDENVPYDEALARGMFQRHDGCGCIIEYTSKKGERTYSESKYSGWSLENPAEKENKILNEQTYFMRNNLPAKYVDERKVGEKIDKQELDKVIRYARDLGVSLGVSPHGFGGFESYCGDSNTLYRIIDETKRQMDSYSYRMSKADPIILRYDNVLGYWHDGKEDKSMIDIDAYAITKGRTITLNKFLFDDTDYLEKKLNREHAENYFAGESIEDIVAHEAGHIIDGKNKNLKENVLDIISALADESNSSIERYVEDNISIYAAESIDEGNNDEIIPELNILLKNDSENAIIQELKKKGILK